MRNSMFFTKQFVQFYDKSFRKMSSLGPMSVTENTGSSHTGTVIFFHGSGDTGQNFQDWVRIISQKAAFQFPHIRVLYPTAPRRKYTPNLGAISTVWFDRFSVQPDVPEDEESLNDMETKINELIRGENALGIPNERIVVGGFSMGGTVAMHTAYRIAPDVAGCFVFSSFLNDDSIVYRHLRKSARREYPELLQLQGDADAVVNIEWGLATNVRLKNLGINTVFEVLPKLGHSLNPRGMKLIRNFVESKLPECCTTY